MRSNGNRRKYMARISEEQLDALPNPTLEDIMASVNGGKYTSFFLKKPKRFKDGSINCLTRSGATAYGKLISIIYACARLTHENVENMVETMDEIVDEEI